MAYLLLDIYALLCISIHGSWGRLGLLEIMGERGRRLQKSAANANGDVPVCGDMDGGAELGVGFLF